MQKTKLDLFFCIAEAHPVLLKYSESREQSKKQSLICFLYQLLEASRTFNNLDVNKT